MITLTLEPKYVNVLKVFGNLEDVLEQAIHQYALEKIQARIAKFEPKVQALELKYGMTYAKFQERVGIDEAFLEQIRQTEVLWEADSNAWEYYSEVLAQWRGRLNNLLN